MVGFVLRIISKNAKLIYLAFTAKNKTTDLFLLKKEKNIVHLQWSSIRSDLTVCGRLLTRRRGQSADCVMC